MHFLEKAGFLCVIALVEILLVLSACHAFCITACKKPAKQFAFGIFNPALPFRCRSVGLGWYISSRWPSFRDVRYADFDLDIIALGLRKLFIPFHERNVI